MAKSDAEKAAAKAASVDGELQAAWEAFLERAEAQRIEDGTHHVFLEQKERGEFDTIPESFKTSHGIRVAPK